MPGTGAKRRKRAAIEDVHKRVWYAFSNNDLTNPYPAEDKRHRMFAQKRARVQQTDEEMEEMHAIHGCDTSQWTRRIHPHPGPVVPLAEL